MINIYKRSSPPESMHNNKTVKVTKILGCTWRRCHLIAINSLYLLWLKSVFAQRTGLSNVLSYMGKVNLTGKDLFKYYLHILSWNGHRKRLRIKHKRLCMITVTTRSMPFYQRTVRWTLFTHFGGGGSCPRDEEGESRFVVQRVKKELK